MNNEIFIKRNEYLYVGIDVVRRDIGINEIGVILIIIGCRCLIMYLSRHNDVIYALAKK